MKLHLGTEQPKELYLQSDETFNKRFNPETGEESVSLWVTENRFGMFEYASTRPDAKGLIAYFACCWIGRAADLERCIGVAVRLSEKDKRIEVRLKFGPPWYWSQIINARHQYAGGHSTSLPQTAADNRAVSPT